jgi:hypothetical protein
MKKLLKFLGLVLLLLIVAVLARTLLIPSKQIAPLPRSPEGVDAQKAARELSGAIPFQTISWEQGGTDEQKQATQQAFLGFHEYSRAHRYPAQARGRRSRRPEVLLLCVNCLKSCCSEPYTC